MTTAHGIPLPGCRHNVLGHALKAIGVLRAITECAPRGDRDPSAEGWWDTDSAAFIIRSDRYPDPDSLAKFFTEKYRPTPIIAAWNKSGGVTDKIEVTITGSADALRQFATDQSDALKELGLTPKTAKNQLEKGKPLAWSPDSSVIQQIRALVDGSSLQVCVSASVTALAAALRTFVADQTEQLQGLGLPKELKVSRSGSLDVDIPWDNLEGLQGLLGAAKLPRASTRKERGGKKDSTLPKIAKLLKNDPIFSECLNLARERVDALQAKETAVVAMLRFRDSVPDGVAEGLDSLSAFHLANRNNNPLFVNRGQQGSTDIFRMYWENFISFRKHSAAHSRASLFAERTTNPRTEQAIQPKRKNTKNKKEQAAWCQHERQRHTILP